MPNDSSKLVRRRFLQTTGASIGLSAIGLPGTAMGSEDSWQANKIGETHFTEVAITHEAPRYTTEKIPIGEYKVENAKLQLYFTDKGTVDLLSQASHAIHADSFHSYPLEYQFQPSQDIVVDRNPGLKPTKHLVIASEYNSIPYRVSKKDGSAIVVEAEEQSTTISAGDKERLKLGTRVVESSGTAPSNPPPENGVTVESKRNSRSETSTTGNTVTRNPTEQVEVTPVLEIRNHGRIDVVNYKLGGDQ